MVRLKLMINKNSGFIFGTVLMFLLLFYCSTKLAMNFAPDEYMRYDVPLFIFNHSHLPNGNEKEIINSIWGFSYGFTPYLPSIISVLFIKIVSLFSSNSIHLLIAARQTSVLAGALTFFICCKIGEEIFHSKKIIYLFAIIVSLLPQFVFVSSYLNNDAFSIFTTALILYAWIRGIKSQWNYKWCVFLGISIGLCALTYYNAYGFILCSIIIYCISSYKLNFSFKEFLIKGFVIAFSAFIVGGWFFIRNAIIHNGDFLGMNSMYECGEKYAQEGYQLSKRNTYQNLGYSVFSIVLSKSWILSTAKSFVCTTGYSQYILSQFEFLGYVIYILMGLVMFVVSIKNRKVTNMKFDRYIYICLLLCVIIPIILSIKYSYSIDYQPQGRYILSALLPISLFSCIGFEYIGDLINDKIKSSIFTSILIGIYIMMFIICFIKYFMPCFINPII